MIPESIKKNIEHITNVSFKRKPLVAIQCITYNHGLYVRDALESFVRQQTDFPFVAIVHDDASTDETAKIIREYTAKYPDIILPIFEIENQFSKDRFAKASEIIKTAINSTGAKYIAMCEGDDFWIDRHKLQRQVEIIESDKKNMLVLHNALIRWENHDKPDKIMCSFDSGYFTLDKIFQKWQLPLASILYKREIINSSEYSKYNSIYPGIGFTYFIVAAKLGKVYGLSECLSVYRKNDGGLSKTLKLANCLIANYKLAEVAECRNAIIYETTKNRKRISIAFCKFILHKNYLENKEVLKTVWKYDKVGWFKCLLFIPVYSFKAIFKRLLINKNNR